MKFILIKDKKISKKNEFFGFSNFLISRLAF